MTIRTTTGLDRPYVASLNNRAFDNPAEAEIIDRLDADGDTILSLVKTENDTIVGHIQFYRIRSDHGDMAGLGPMSVDPALQRSGIGAALIEAGVTQLRARGEHPVLFVLGHMDYYPRFGFSAARARDFVSPYSGDPFGDAFMAMDLQNNAPRQARLRFPKAFS